MTDRQTMAKGLREDALLVLAKMQLEGEKIAYRMGLAADLLDGRAKHDQSADWKLVLYAAAAAVLLGSNVLSVMYL
jgi:hypothetical protein